MAREYFIAQKEVRVLCVGGHLVTELRKAQHLR